jgi:two-component SAPR family response regulator
LILGESNIDLVHGVFPGNPNTFELILGDRTSKIAFHVPDEEITNDWIKLRFEIDFKNSKITGYVKDRVLTDDLTGYEDKYGLRLMFGAHSFGEFASTDVPGMTIRDVEIKMDDKIAYNWPLDETVGTIVHSFPDGFDGVAFNPEWILKQHNTWDQQINLEIEGGAKIAFDSRNDDLYIVSKDSVYVLNVVDNSMRRIFQKSPSYIESTSELIYDTISGRLILYSLDDNYLSQFNFETGKWTPQITGTAPHTVYWHHNRFMTPDGSLLTFGGYGQYLYKNSVLAWNPGGNYFDSIAFKGDFHPRYLAGSGFNHSDSLVYLIGGFGSESGKQSESPNYYYEILSFSLADSTFSRVVDFQNTKTGFCFANSIVFDDSNNLYALCYSKYQFQNQLQLIQIPLDRPEIIELGDAIEYNFIDINSFADLHYSKNSNVLLAVSSFSSEGKTSITAYSISFPPQPIALQKSVVERGDPSVAFYPIASVVLMVSVFLLYRHRKKRIASEKKPAVVRQGTIHKRKENSIYLFGGFQVFDKHGNDITARFTPLPKKLFLFIMLNSLRNEKGVSSNALYETFWFDKSVESARNNRAVNIVKLKSLLDHLETASISKETGYWKFDFDPTMIYIDYYEYLQIVGSSTELSRNDIVSLLSTFEGRPFLKNTDADWLDPFKSEISNEIIDTFLKYIGKSDDDPDFLQHIVNSLFIFDPVSEEALKIQCRLLIRQGKHSLAKKSYSRFVNEYRKLYDEEYGLSFNQIIEKD